MEAIAALVLTWIAGAALYNEVVKEPVPPTTIAAIAKQWGDLFGFPADLIVAVAYNESRLNAKATNLTSPGDVLRGGAWGLMQQTLQTAKSNVAALLKSEYANDENVKAALLKWDGSGKSLYDPGLNMMLGAFQLATYLKRFPGNENAAIGAYNRGGKGMQTYLAAGYDPANLNYVKHVRSALET
jgi:soluble lytic murein transglycosylase-like protein